MSTRNPAQYLREHAARAPEQPALHFPSRNYRTQDPHWDSLSFAELDKRSDAFARGLQAQGVKRGDRVLMLMKPSLQLYEVLFGLMKMGGVPVLLDPGMGVKPLLQCIEDNKPRVVIALSAVHAVATFVRKPFASAELFITVGSRWWWGGPTIDDCAIEADEPFELPGLEDDDDFAIVFTSGSTGTPKGVEWSQRVFHSQVDTIRAMTDAQPGTAEVQCFASFAIHNVCFGQTAILPSMNLSKPATADPADIVAAIHHFEPRGAFASPIVWINTGRYCTQKGLKLPSLARIATTGAPIPVHVHQQYRQIVPEGTQLWTPYGATEAMGIALIGSDEILDETQALTDQGAGTCVGSPAPGIQIRIARITDEPIETWSDDHEAPAGEIGEIVVGGGVVSRAYKDKPVANAESKIRDGQAVLHRVGDLGYFDDKGRLWFCGRKSHRVRTADGMVPSVPVEGLFNGHPKVMRTALVGVGPVGRQVPVLCVETEPGERFDDALVGELQSRAAGTRYEGVVARFVDVPNFPTDARHNSKIRRGDLKQRMDRQCADLLQGAAA